MQTDKRPIEVGQMWRSDSTSNIWVVVKILDANRLVMRLKAKADDTAIFDRGTLELPTWKQLGDESVFDSWTREQAISDIEEGKIPQRPQNAGDLCVACGCGPCVCNVLKAIEGN